MHTDLIIIKSNAARANFIFRDTFTGISPDKITSEKRSIRYLDNRLKALQKLNTVIFLFKGKILEVFKSFEKSAILCNRPFYRYGGHLDFYCLE